MTLNFSKEMFVIYYAYILRSIIKIGTLIYVLYIVVKCYMVINDFLSITHTGY